MGRGNVKKAPTKITPEKKEYYGSVTRLSDQPNRKENEAKWMEWYKKLDKDDLELLRERGEDPFDTWR